MTSRGVEGALVFSAWLYALGSLLISGAYYAELQGGLASSQTGRMVKGWLIECSNFLDIIKHITLIYLSKIGVQIYTITPW